MAGHGDRMPLFVVIKVRMHETCHGNLPIIGDPFCGDKGIKEALWDV